ncbi:MAG TPA: hypothetical protein V6D08_10080 [Candidatus Obscuribacterales bacterium]
MPEQSLDRANGESGAVTFDSVWQEIARENSGFVRGLEAEARLLKGAASNIVPGVKEAAQYAIDHPVSTGVKLLGMVALGYGLGSFMRVSVFQTAVRGAFAYALLADGVRPMVRSTSFVWDNRNDMALQYQQKQLGRGLGHFAFDLGLTMPAIGLGVRLARTPKLGASGADPVPAARTSPEGGGGGAGGARVEVPAETSAGVKEKLTPAAEVKGVEPVVEPAAPVRQPVPEVLSGGAAEAAAAEVKGPRNLHEAILELARMLKKPGSDVPPATEVKAPEVVTPPAAEVKAPEVVTPPAGEAKIPEVIPPQEVDIVFMPKTEPVRVSESTRTQSAGAAEKADASTAGSGDAAGRKVDQLPSEYQAVAPEPPRAVDEVVPPQEPVSVEPPATAPRAEQPRTKQRTDRARPQELRAEDDDLYAGLDARTRRQIEQEEAEWRQERGRKPGKGRQGKKGGKRGWDDEY